MKALSITAQAAPLACAAHCLAMPLIAASSPLLASPETEWAFLATGALVSLLAAAEAVRHHRKWAAPAAVLVAVLAWTLSLAGAFAPVPEEVTSTAACLGLAAASLWGARLRHRARCATCTCPAGHGEHHRHD